MKVCVFVILIFSSSFSSLFSQYNSDLFESWNSIKIDYKISEKFEINYEIQLRLKSDRELYDQLFNELDFKYNISKNLYTGYVFRFSEKNDDYGNYTGSKNFTRSQLYLGYKIEKWRFQIDLKAKYQIKNKISSDYIYKLYIPKKYFRYKISILKNFKNWKLDPKVNFEFFVRDKSYANIYDKVRISFGTRYKFDNENSINFGYFNDNDFSFPFRIQGLKIRYNFSL